MLCTSRIGLPYKHKKDIIVFENRDAQSLNSKEEEMKARKTVPYAIMAALLLLVSGPALAGMSSASYQIPNDVLSGGGSTMSSANYTMSSTLGQSSPLGTASSSSYVNYPGFWQADECVWDADGDDLANAEEYGYGTDPYNYDSDGDSLGDGEEVTSGDDGYVTDPLEYSSDGDSLGDGDEYANGTNPLDEDSDDDGADDYVEVTWADTLDPLYWDSDGDALPDGFEVANYNHTPDPLDPADASDGPTDFDGDSNPNVHEYWNGSDVWSQSIVSGAGCYSWGDSGNTVSADGLVSPLDLVPLQNRINLKPASYTGVIPPNGDSQEMDMDQLISPLDLGIMKGMAALSNTSGNPAIPTDLVVSGSTTLSVEVGYTCHVTVGVANNYPNYTPSIGVIFSIDSGSTGTATLLGGEGVSGSGRYDVSGAIASGGQSTVVMRVDSAGTIYLNAEAPACSAGGIGRYCPGVIKNQLVTIVGY